ncbi:MAG TPA: hypothetical protein DCS29_03455 [Candidatus Magasanikbacteria bacterium]|nr:MAG: hypothetical protein A2479_00730 [Candidatus Magasanikbacteria bacterium RIFOXYC2_FULL_39_8]HAT03801.1 hypothetical protein [Candidatus Magasanikbacteria bacterium]
MFFKMRQSNYNLSNAIETIDFIISPQAHLHTKKLLRSKSEELRQKYGDELLDELADLARIDIVRLKISSAKQYHKKYKGRIVSRLYGYYKPGSKYIYINNRTAVRGQILAPKTFLDTLLHEWLHHYDHCKLGLHSIHTSGFYARLKDLKEKVGYFDT